MISKHMLEKERRNRNMEPKGNIMIHRDEAEDN